MILCRDCLVHLTFDDARAALQNLRRSGSKYLLTTTFTDPHPVIGTSTPQVSGVHWILSKVRSSFRTPLELHQRGVSGGQREIRRQVPGPVAPIGDSHVTTSGARPTAVGAGRPPWLAFPRVELQLSSVCGTVGGTGTRRGWLVRDGKAWWTVRILTRYVPSWVARVGWPVSSCRSVKLLPTGDTRSMSSTAPSVISASSGTSWHTR